MRALALTLAVVACASPEPPSVPPCGVTPDGVLNVAEWQGAQRIDLEGGAVLWLNQTTDHICLAAETRPAGLKFVDIFITDSAGVTRNLHASMQVGERVVPARGWTDSTPPTVWGQTTSWRANNVRRRPDLAEGTPLGEQLAPYDGYEFVIERATFPRPWRMHVEVRDFLGEARTIVWPERSRRNDQTSWAVLP